ncbi:hypothetical protein [Dongia sp.]|uniref:hypothetical protein n=1 Tax=Dongia sp. TaxID=1977262 RepID=UPI0035B49CC8
MATMGYKEAFKKMGYSLLVPRQDWSAISDKGVCLAIWRKELTMIGGLPHLDTRTVAGPIEIWGRKPGNALRIEHLKTARDRFNGVIDAIIVEGEPGQGVTDATPWLPSERKGTKWHLTYLDEATGHYAVEVRKS